MSELARTVSYALIKVEKSNTEEKLRLNEDRKREKNWKRWGPYISERQWGTVREDYSEYGDSWNFVSHDMSRSYAYRWGEDGILGITDRQCRLCFALCMWNEKDPILKERLFGLTGPESNHGEDVKELYYYIESSPTHSYMKGLYKYPQGEFPYADLVNTNRSRTRLDPEYEILDTGIFKDNKYWDVFAEYAKDNPNDILIRITVANRSNEEQTIHLLPTLWHRNTWTFKARFEPNHDFKRIEKDPKNPSILRTSSEELGSYTFECESFVEGKTYSKTDARNFLKQPPQWLFTENNTNNDRLYKTNNETEYVKDAFHDYVIHNQKQAINPNHIGSKAAAHHVLRIPANSQAEIKLRLYSDQEAPKETFGASFDETFENRKKDMDDYYNEIIPNELTSEEKSVCLQGFAGLLWSKQFFYYVILDWLDGDPTTPKPPESRKKGRNNDWKHLFNRDIISMPDKWEYPWYAVWDLAFHMVTFALFDIDFAKEQLLMFLREWYMHPNGCLPAYEFNFGDVNPPVHAWACWKVYKMTGSEGERDTAWLAKVFQKLIINFTWWVNRKDPEGHNLFAGGFLGLDNIGVFDRNQSLPLGGKLMQADGTSWMGFYCVYMLKISMELAVHLDSSYEDLASKFFEHFVLISDAMNAMTEGQNGLWDCDDQFYYDHLTGCTFDPSKHIPLKIRSLVGLSPLFASGVIPRSQMEKLKGFTKRTEWFLKYRKDLAVQIELLEPTEGEEETHDVHFLSIPKADRIKSTLKYLYDSEEFLSPYGIRSLSKFHKNNPYVFWNNNEKLTCTYLPAESDTGMFGGNSNWRGPVWMPMNYLLIEALERLDHVYKGGMAIEFPTGKGRKLRPYDAAINISYRLAALFLPDHRGRRPSHGKYAEIYTDPHFKDYIHFYEYFHGDDGSGLGASHQTGWTSLVVNCLFRVGIDREKKLRALDQEGFRFYQENLVNFNKEMWSKVDLTEHIDFAIVMQQIYVDKVEELMEIAYNHSLWLYKTLLLKFTVVKYKTNYFRF